VGGIAFAAPGSALHPTHMAPLAVAAAGPPAGRSERELYRPPPPKGAVRPPRPPPGIGAGGPTPASEQGRSAAQGGGQAAGNAAGDGDGGGRGRGDRNPRGGRGPRVERTAEGRIPVDRAPMDASGPSLGTPKW